MKDNFSLKVFLCFLFFTCILSVSFAQQALTINGQGAIVSASGEMKDGLEDYSVKQVFDGNPETSWISMNDFETGAGEWIRITFTKPAQVFALRLSPGQSLNGENQKKYARIKKFAVIMESEDGKRNVKTFEQRQDSGPGMDMVLLLNEKASVKTLTVKVFSVFPGKEENKLAIGILEPVLLKDGKKITGSNALIGAFSFLETARDPKNAFQFVPDGKDLKIRRVIFSSNPMDKSEKIDKTNKFTKEQLKKDWSVWENVCILMAADFQFRSKDAIHYMWKDHSAGTLMFKLNTDENADVLSSYTFGYTLNNFKDKIRIKDENTGTVAEKEVSIEKPVLSSIKTVENFYSP